MEEKTKDLEKKEVERMISDGFKLSLTYEIVRRNWFGKKIKEKVKKDFVIAEPTCGTLDRICKLALDIELNDPEYEKCSDQGRVRLMVTRYAMTACKIIATAILGSEYRELIERKGRTSIHEMDEKVESLANIIYHAVKPSELKTMTYFVMATENLPDFSASIMLMSVERTTKPTMVEGEQKA